MSFRPVEMTAPESSWSPEKGINRDMCVRRKGEKRDHSPGPRVCRGQATWLDSDLAVQV